MILGLALWALRKRRADIVDVLAKAAWFVMGSALLVLLGVRITGQG